MKKDFTLGHVLYFTINKNNKIVFRDKYGRFTKEPKTCIYCGKQKTNDGHDPCIANLPGVIYACCGHNIREGYIAFKIPNKNRMLIIRGYFSSVEIIDNDKKEHKINTIIDNRILRKINSLLIKETAGFKKQ